MAIFEAAEGDREENNEIKRPVSVTCGGNNQLRVNIPSNVVDELNLTSDDWVILQADAEQNRITMVVQ